MTNKQTLAALQEAIRIADSEWSVKDKYTALFTSVKSLIAALEVDVKGEDTRSQEGNIVSRVTQFMSDKG